MSSLRIAWRNLWRNGRRTWITVAAVALNTAVLIVSFGLIDGINVQLQTNATDVVVGNAQIHAHSYLKDHSIYKTVASPDRILRAATDAGIEAAPRSYGFGLVSMGVKSAGARFWGVEPRAEKAAFTLPRRLASGEYLSDSPQREVLLGRKLARSLNAEVGSELVAVVQGADGSLGNELLKVRGILLTVSEDIDRSAAILHRRDFDELFVSDGRVNEIALRSPAGMSDKQLVASITPAVAGKDEPDEVLTWRQVLPLLSDMLNLNASLMWIFAVIFWSAAALGVMNTMLMATHDRVRELGVLKALGCTPWRIIRDVALEAWTLAVVATALGTAVGLAGSWYFRDHGIDLTRLGGGDMTFGGVAFDPIWRATLSPGHVVYAIATMWVACVVVSLYPATKAARLNPARAMTHV